MQGQARQWRRSKSAPGDADYVLGVRGGDYGSLQANTRQACAMPLLLSKAGDPAAAVARTRPHGRLESRRENQVALEARRKPGGADQGGKLRPVTLAVQESMSRHLAP